MADFGNVVQLINRLQSACTLLGDNAASDNSLPGLWDLLPSIVVIGGQVQSRSMCLCIFTPTCTQAGFLSAFDRGATDLQR